jgi:hypothetical protein
LEKQKGLSMITEQSPEGQFDRFAENPVHYQISAYLFSGLFIFGFDLGKIE